MDEGSEPNNLPDAATPAARLIDARVKAGFKSCRAASEHHGWKESSYRSHENGWRPLKRAHAVQYGEAFNVSTDWILSGVGSPPVPAEQLGFQPAKAAQGSARSSGGSVIISEASQGLWRVQFDKVVPSAVASKIIALLSDE